MGCFSLEPSPWSPTHSQKPLKTTLTLQGQLTSSTGKQNQNSRQLMAEIRLLRAFFMEICSPRFLFLSPLEQWQHSNFIGNAASQCPLLLAILKERAKISDRPDSEQIPMYLLSLNTISINTLQSYPSPRVSPKSWLWSLELCHILVISAHSRLGQGVHKLEARLGNTVRPSGKTDR